MPHRLINNQLDFILFEEGSFSPLNWLLREGHLDYNDYLDWKKGTTKYLEDHFKTPVATIITALETVKAYAGLLKLESSRETYISTDNQTLHFCRSAADELIFTTVYEPAHDRIQMDLFFDSADSCAVANVVNAIIEGDSLNIADLLLKLATLNPDKHLRFKQLLGFEQQIIHNTLSTEQRIAVLIQNTTPLAFELLGRFTLDFLTPLWHTLSAEVADLHFDADQPQNHLSFTAFKEFQWQQALQSIKREKDWNKQPLLIFRYAESCFKLNKDREGIEHWFELFIRFPDDAECLIKDSANRLMFADWQSFAELDPELESSLFPAWVVMNKPALAKNTVTSEVIDNEALQLIKQLSLNTQEVINDTVIQLRARLQQSSPALFVHYMRANSEDY